MRFMLFSFSPGRCTARRALAVAAIFSLALAPVVTRSQQTTPPAAQQQQQQPPPQGMGVSTGTALVSATRRTVGIVDPKAPKVFEDVTMRTALAQFKHRSGGPQKDYIIECVSGGVAIFDYDNDGLPDIYILNGSTIAPEHAKEKPTRAALYHNLGGWKFAYVTDKPGVANERWGRGGAAADDDNDRFPCIYAGNLS